MLNLDVPRGAVRRKIPRFIFPEYECRTDRPTPRNDVLETSGTVDDLEAVAVSGDHHLLVTIKCIDAQWHAIIKQPEPTANRGLLVLKRGPRDPGAWR